MPGKKKRVAVIGAGSFGRNHLRVLHQLDSVDLVAVSDLDTDRAAAAAQQYGCEALQDVVGKVDGAIVATPTASHADIAGRLLENGVDVMVEKPIALSVAEGRKLVQTAERYGRILQVGHLERFNPAVQAVRKIAKLPLFFEIHRLSLFSPRSLDVDVVLDLMIHDIDVVLNLTGKMPEEIRAAGIRILSDKVDIANVRLAFPGGCVANLTASRVSVERVRKLRMFQPEHYVSVDYARQDVAAFRVAPERQIVPEPLEVHKDEPLRLELEAFVCAMETREPPLVTGEDAVRALEVAIAIADKIEEHSRVVTRSIAAMGSATS